MKAMVISKEPLTRTDIDDVLPALPVVSSCRTAEMVSRLGGDSPSANVLPSAMWELGI